MTDSLVEVSKLSKSYPTRGGRNGDMFHAVRSVSFAIPKHATFCLVGESGAGKTTVGRMIAGLVPPSDGRIDMFGVSVSGGQRRSPYRGIRQNIQFIFQDPFGSLNPKLQIGNSIGEPLLMSRAMGRLERQERVRDLLAMVGLPGDAATRFPHEFSGGQRQRIAIARAIATNPALIICDEPVSALDLSIQAQVLNLLKDIQADQGATYLFVSHDLAVVRYIGTHIGVMYAGELVEVATCDQFYRHPAHPYSRVLFDSVPKFGGKAEATYVRAPNMQRLDQGCSFSNRCPMATSRCTQEKPLLRDIGNNQSAACHFA